MTYSSEPIFDAAIGLCEGTMGLLGQGDDPIERDLAVLRNVYAALKPNGQFIVNPGVHCPGIHRAFTVELTVRYPLTGCFANPCRQRTCGEVACLVARPPSRGGCPRGWPARP